MSSSVHVAFLLLVLSNIVTAKVMQPYAVDESDEDSIYIPEEPPCRSTGSMMAMSYNQSVPFAALRECDRQQAAACPSPSDDGTYLCVVLADLCDGRPQCPGGEDESATMCFFFEMYSIELRRLRNFAKRLLREAEDSNDTAARRF